jgi:hypothetical protein
MPYNGEKFKALVHYVCWKVDDPRQLGATKLNKILWFSDILTYLNFNAPVTGARYVKRQFGPVAVALLPVIEELKDRGKLAVRDAEYFGKPKMEYFALQAPDVSRFSPEEISLVDSVIHSVCEEHTAASISKLTHNDAWEMADIGEDLPFFTVFSARSGEIDENDIAWADQQIERLRADAR